MGSWRSIPCRNAYRPPNAVYAGCLEALRVALQRDGAPVSITQIMPRTINTRCPTTSRTKIAPISPLTATAHDGRLIGHGIRAGPAMITTLRWRLLAVPGPPDPSRPPDHPAPTAPRRPARPRSSPCLNRPDQAERPQHSPGTRSPEAGTRAVCAAQHPVYAPININSFEPSLA